ncbi:hypothetical protein J7E62_31485 [Variovorax paradoxus]|nr:hypothetical protein [Variovorax paradoxus]
MTEEIGQRAAKLREEHLRTHLAQVAILDAAQIQRYAQLRGYALPSGTDAPSAEAVHPKPAGRHSGH